MGTVELGLDAVVAYGQVECLDIGEVLQSL